jgi:hypothetical protein
MRSSHIPSVQEIATHSQKYYRYLMTVFSAGYRDYFGGSTPFGLIAPAFQRAYNRSTLVEILRQVPGSEMRG